jgi:hypothetical protein
MNGIIRTRHRQVINPLDGLLPAFSANTKPRRRALGSGFRARLARWERVEAGGKDRRATPPAPSSSHWVPTPSRSVTASSRDPAYAVRTGAGEYPGQCYRAGTGRNQGHARPHDPRRAGSEGCRSGATRRQTNCRHRCSSGRQQASLVSAHILNVDGGFAQPDFCLMPVVCCWHCHSQLVWNKRIYLQVLEKIIDINIP